ncbi:hypothetical protein K435DRAFT_787530 [Dendrothele bispora CBS 962.96]|uniref:Uncharacterized protein n=1 Tax=Dendrothele bispora (strain CBS 962.96) TaxID=1314807 RepID=A0A4S8KJS9_DENBC|nr:hypothetical protein K435DRAFT_787530 [Dendrothele bispora CBS 962.96]
MRVLEPMVSRVLAVSPAVQSLAHAALQGDEFNYQKPFSHEVIPAYMGAVYFANSKLARALDVQKQRLCVFNPRRELPKGIVAMAACVVCFFFYFCKDQCQYIPLTT